MAPPAVKMKGIKVLMVLIVSLLCTSPTSAFWRVLCKGMLGPARIDPVVSAGKISMHAHAAFGARSFGLSSTADEMMQANCTTCQITEDRSLYWAPALYFKHDNGTFELVPNLGGTTVYYFTNETATLPPFNITPFPPNFRMIAGDFLRRNASEWDLSKDMSFWNASDMSQASLTAKSLGFNCLHYGKGNEASLEFNYIRDRTVLNTCVDGLRLELMFPSCWNGKDLDSKDHKSHIMYPNLRKYGECPSGFEVKVPVLFYETTWNVAYFNDFAGQFTLAHGDPTGYGYHGDFIAGWNESFLGNAIQTCSNGSGRAEDCSLLTLQDEAIQTSCKMTLPEALKEEITTGLVGNALPGNNPIQPGPQQAVMYLDAADTTVSQSAPPMSTSPVSSSSTDVASSPATMATSVHSNTTNFVPTPTTTPAPSMTTSPYVVTSPPETFSYTTVTSSFISNGVEIFVVMVEEIYTVTVTEAVTATTTVAYNKRHVHRHGRNRRAVS